MSTVAKSFTATGVGISISIKANDSVSYSVSGTFVGTAILEKSDDGINFQLIRSVTAADSGTIVNGPQQAHYRYHCSAYTSGTIVTSVADAASSVPFIEHRDSSGAVVFQVTEAGVVVPDVSGITTAYVAADVVVTAAISNEVENAQTGTTYTFALADVGKRVTASNAGAQTYTVPPNSSVAFTIGSIINIQQIGAGQVTIAQGAGVTVNATPGLKFRAQHSGASLWKQATNVWWLTGDLSA